jgi:hypothetical protein
MSIEPFIDTRSASRILTTQNLHPMNEQGTIIAHTTTTTISQENRLMLKGTDPNSGISDAEVINPDEKEGQKNGDYSKSTGEDKPKPTTNKTGLSNPNTNDDELLFISPDTARNQTVDPHLKSIETPTEENDKIYDHKSNQMSEKTSKTSESTAKMLKSSEDPESECQRSSNVNFEKIQVLNQNKDKGDGKSDITTEDAEMKTQEKNPKNQCEREEGNEIPMKHANNEDHPRPPADIFSKSSPDSNISIFNFATCSNARNDLCTKMKIDQKKCEEENDCPIKERICAVPNSSEDERRQDLTILTSPPGHSTDKDQLRGPRGSEQTGSINITYVTTENHKENVKTLSTSTNSDMTKITNLVDLTLNFCPNSSKDSRRAQNQTDNNEISTCMETDQPSVLSVKINKLPQIQERSSKEKRKADSSERSSQNKHQKTNRKDKSSHTESSGQIQSTNEQNRFENYHDWNEEEEEEEPTFTFPVQVQQERYSMHLEKEVEDQPLPRGYWFMFRLGGLVHHVMDKIKTFFSSWILSESMWRRTFIGRARSSAIVLVCFERSQACIGALMALQMENISDVHIITSRKLPDIDMCDEEISEKIYDVELSHYISRKTSMRDVIASLPSNIEFLDTEAKLNHEEKVFKNTWERWWTCSFQNNGCSEEEPTYRDLLDNHVLVARKFQTERGDKRLFLILSCEHSLLRGTKFGDGKPVVQQWKRKSGKGWIVQIVSVCLDRLAQQIFPDLRNMLPRRN